MGPMTMPILNFGSINIDFAYRVQRFAEAGETVRSLHHQLFAGGKGFNQSIALARAGAQPRHVGRVGHDGRWLVDKLHNEGVTVDEIEFGDTPTGHAIIQVDESGENNILVHGGANQEISKEHIDLVSKKFDQDVWLLLQNETNGIETILQKASERGSRIILNPSPIDEQLMSLPLHLVDLFILNRTEGTALTGERETDGIMTALERIFPKAEFALTLGQEGVMYSQSGERLYIEAERVEALDTTGAGDTFAGFFLAELHAGADLKKALEIACRASALCVTRPGASDSIPKKFELSI